MRTKVGLLPVSIVGTRSGTIIDRQGFGGVEFVIGYGAVTTTGTVSTVVIKDGDVTGTMVSVANSALLGTEALASLLAATPRTAGTTKEVSKRIGYVGVKRYVSCDHVTSGTTSVGLVDQKVILHSPELAPQANP